MNERPPHEPWERRRLAGGAPDCNSPARPRRSRAGPAGSGVQCANFGSGNSLIDADGPKIFSLPDETQFAANGIVSRTLLRTRTTRVVLFGFAEGQELSEHTSTAQAFIQILSGRCEFSLDGKPRLLNTGDLLHLPPNLPHAVKATEKFSMLLTLLKPAEPAPGLSRVKAVTRVAKQTITQ